MSLFSALQSGASGLFSASRGLDVTAHNVANANTPGFTRRSVALGTANPIQNGAMGIGQGVEMQGVLRPNDSLLGVRTLTTAGATASAMTLHQELSNVEHWFDESMSQGPRLAMSAFFDALGDATLDPSDPSSRTAVLHAAANLSATISDTTQGLTQSQSDLSERMESALPAINQVLEEVASLNEQIANAGGSLSAGDLADQRDLLLRQLSEEVGTTVSFNASGEATVFLSGHALVEGGHANKLSFSQTEAGEPRLGVDIGENSTMDITDALGGRLGGFRDARATIGSYIDDLNEFTTSFATSINDTLGAGYDLNGNPGEPLFAWDPANPGASLTLNETIEGQPDMLAFASSADAEAGDAGNLEALIAVEENATVGGRPPGEFLSSLTNRVGMDVATAASNADRNAASLGDMDAISQSLRGVDMDQEAMHLMEWQTAYQAAAKVLEVVDESIGVLMELP